MANIKFTVDAEEAKAVRAMLKVVDAQRKVEDGSRRASTASRGHSTAMQQAGRSAAREFTGMVAGWASIGAAIALVQRGIQTTIEDMKRLDEQNAAATKSMMQHIAASGDLLNRRKVQGFLLGDEFAGAGAGLQARGDIYGAVRGAMPTGDLGRVLAITAQAAHAGKAGFDRVAFGMTAGEIGKVMPAATAEDVADLATLVATAEGRHGRKVRRGGWKAVQKWTASGMGTAEQGIGYMLASMEAGQGTEAFETMARKMVEERVFAPLAFGQTQTEKQRMEREFFGADAAGRLAMIKSDQKLRRTMLGTEVAGVEAMLARDPDKFARAGVLARQQNIAVWSQAAALKDERWAREHEIAEEIARAEVAEYRRDEGREMASVRYEKAAMRRAGVPAAIRGMLGWAGETAAGFGRDSGDVPYQTSGAPDEMIAGQLDVMSDAAQKNLQAAEMNLEAARMNAGGRTPNIQSQVMD